MRKSNIELLRILSMILIVMSHCDDRFGLADLYSTGLGINKVITDWLDAGGQIGVGCFLLISGYFMIEQTVTLKKVLKIAGQVWFYTVGIFVVWLVASLIFGNAGLSFGKIAKEAVLAFFPITFSEYWFVTAYIILMVLSPFCNKLIFALDKKEYQALLASLIIIFVALQGGIPNVFRGMAGGRIIPVVIYYFIAGYIKRFVVLSENNARRHIFVAICFYCLLIASFYVLTWLGITLDSGTIIEHSSRYRQLQSPIVLIICLELFIAFMEMDIKGSKFINEVAACTFGVYLIQSNRIMRELIAGWFPVYKEERSLFIFLYSVAGVIAIYVCCTIVDFIRRKFVERHWISLLDKKIIPLSKIVLARLMSMYNNIKNGLFGFYSNKKAR